jgi:hypothetical protein
MTHDLAGGVTLGHVRLKRFYVQVGPVPLVLQPILTLRLISDGTVTAGLHTSVSASASLGIEITTDDGDVEATPIRKWETGYTPPTLYANVRARAGVGVKLALSVNGLGGPFLTNDLWVLSLDADVTKSPWWRLSVENDVGAGFELKVLGRTLASWSDSTLAHFEHEYARAPGAFTRLAITPGRAAVAPGAAVRLTASSAGQPAANVTWSANGGSITKDGVFTAPAAAGTYTVLASAPAGGLLPAATGLASVRVGPQPPGAPTGVTAAAKGVDKATVRWTPPADTGGGPITGYTVVASPGGWEHVVGASATETTVWLRGGETYTFTVTAETAAGTSVESAPSEPVLVHDAERLDSYVDLTHLGPGRRPSLNADGRYVTWTGNDGVFRHDTMTGATVDLTALFGRTPLYVDSGPGMDSTGSIVTWRESDCWTSTFVRGDVRTGVAKEIGSLIQPCYDSVPPVSDAPDISADGRFVVFHGVPAGTEPEWYEHEYGAHCRNCRDYLYDAQEDSYVELPRGTWRLSGDGRYLYSGPGRYERATGLVESIPHGCGVMFMIVYEVNHDGSISAGLCSDVEITNEGYVLNAVTGEYTELGHRVFPVAMDDSGRSIATQSWQCAFDCWQSVVVSDPDGRHGAGPARSAALSGDGATVAVERSDGIWLGHL